MSEGYWQVRSCWTRIDEVIAERDEAREIAVELARYIRTNPPRYPLYRDEGNAWYAIRPGVRKFLGGK